ncbi:MAG: hypothetical protein M0C28_41885 [Candidatus Moduliflexus flocculans]|nr:hypothetical protein [Candidatus Moduliflexus flocculans]
MARPAELQPHPERQRRRGGGDLGRRQALAPEVDHQRPAVLRRRRRQRAALQRHGRHPGQRRLVGTVPEPQSAGASSPPTGTTCRRATPTTSSATGGTPSTSTTRASSAPRAASTSTTGEISALAKRTTARGGWPRAMPAQRYQWNAPIVLSPHNPGIVYICSPVRPPLPQPGRAGHLRDHQPGPVPGRQDAPRGVEEDQPPVRDDLQLRRVGQEAGPLLGRDRRRQRPDVARRRRHLDEHHGPVLRHEDGQGQARRQGRPHPVRPLGEAGRPVAVRRERPATWPSTATGPTTRTRPGSSSPSDLGKTWEDISGGLMNPVWDLEEDPDNADVLYAGTDYGVCVTIDQGKTWTAVLRPRRRT